MFLRGVNQPSSPTFEGSVRCRHDEVGKKAPRSCRIATPPHVISKSRRRIGLGEGARRHQTSAGDVR
jgi:hypothetical protein